MALSCLNVSPLYQILLHFELLPPTHFIPILRHQPPQLPPPPPPRNIGLGGTSVVGKYQHMSRTRGFLFKHRVVTMIRQVSRHHRFRVDPQAVCRVKKPISKLISWTHRLGSRLAKATVSKKLDKGRGYSRVEYDPDSLEKPAPVPKGHLAVYVGQKDGDFQRILVPVVYFNHPLFGDLLKESEKEYGFDHPGGITIPCRISEFEQIQTRIKTVHCTRKKIRYTIF